MKKSIIKAAALMGFMVLFTSCVKEVVSNNELYRPEGTPISFMAETGYSNGIETRTEYSGVFSDVTNFSNKFERIDWVTGDPIKIFYANTEAYGSYTIGSSITPDAENSRAELGSITDLTWGGGSGDHLFYAMYPGATYKGNSSAVLNGSQVSGIIPDAQTVTLKGTTAEDETYEPNMAYGYMVCKKTIHSNEDATSVDLPFRPAMTAFNFRLKKGSGDDAVITNFKMISSDSYLAGKFSFDMQNKADTDDREASSWGNVSLAETPAPSKVITVTFPANTKLTSKYLDFTVFALPVDLSNITLQFTFSNGDTKSLKLKRGDTWDSFSACKKYVITNQYVPGTESWDYFIEEIPDVITYGHSPVTATDVYTYDVKSYKMKHGTTGPKYPVAWHLEYSTNGTNWSTTFPSTGYSALTATTGVGYDGTVSYPAEPGYSTLPNASTGTSTGQAQDATRAKLVIAPPRGSSEAPFDLSKHPVYGVGESYEVKQAYITNTTVDRETANCYVVSAPGVYMFPLVYGNAIKANQDNKAAYDPAHCGIQAIEDLYTVTNRQVLPTFRNARNVGITKPGIKADLSATELSAVVVWQDAQNLILNPTVIDVPGEDYPFIKFEVDVNYIAQGNAIVALKGDATGLDDEILWSWHIWITEKDLTPAQINHPVSTHSMMMTYNLGWTDKTTASSTQYPDRKIYVRVVQNEKSASATDYEKEPFIFWQKGDAISTNPNVGSNPFYQWGRKDPMVGAASDNHYKVVYYGSGYSLPTTDYNGQTVVTPSTPTSATNGQFADAIKNPHKQYFNVNNWSWIGGPTYMTNGTGNSNNPNPSIPDQSHYQDTSIPSNLWNFGVNHQAGGEAHHKTVYDPCPAGFCVPNSYAFMGMAGFTGNTAAQDWRYNVSEHSSSAPEGRTFSIGSSMYFPFTGARGARYGEIYSVNETAYYWVGSITSNTYNQGTADGRKTEDQYGYFNSKMMYFDSEWIWPFHNLYRAACYSLRPVVE